MKEIEQLKAIKREDYIWIIYFFIAFLALYSNKFEKDYIYTKNKQAYKNKKNINIFIFTVAFLIYWYFLTQKYENIKNFKQNMSNEVYVNNLAQLIAAILFLIGGFIYLITEIKDPEPGEIGFI